MLLIGAVLPAYAAISLADDYQENFELAEFYGADSKILICTSDGFKFVSVAELKEGKELPNKTHCKLCLASSVQDKYEIARLTYLQNVQQDVLEIKQSITESDVAYTAPTSQKHSRAPPKSS